MFIPRYKVFLNREINVNSALQSAKTAGINVYSALQSLLNRGINVNSSLQSL